MTMPLSPRAAAVAGPRPALPAHRATGSLAALAAGLVLGATLAYASAAWPRRPVPDAQAAGAAPRPAFATPASPPADVALPAPEPEAPPLPVTDTLGGPYVALSDAGLAPSGAIVWGIPPAPAAAVDVAAGADPAAAPAPDTAAPVPADPQRFRPAPAQGIPPGLAVRLPLLAVLRPGGRVAFHELGRTPGPVPAGLEGEWSVPGACARTVRVELALPSRGAGHLRAVGRVVSGEGGTVAPVVPRQACAAASRGYAPARSPTAAERTAMASAGAEMGFGAGDLREMAGVAGAIVLVFRGDDGAAGVAVRARGATGPVWTHRAAPADGPVRLLGVYRAGAATEAWLVIGASDRPASLLVVSSADGRRWTSDGPVPLGDRPAAPPYEVSGR